MGNVDGYSLLPFRRQAVEEIGDLRLSLPLAPGNPLDRLVLVLVYRPGFQK